MIKYNEYELLELFESEPKIIGEKEVCIYDYKRTDMHGFTLALYLSTFDEFCNLTLSYKDFKDPLFDIGFHKVKNIECSENRLIIKQEDKIESIVAYFKPNYSLTSEKRLL